MIDFNKQYLNADEVMLIGFSNALVADTRI